MKLFKKISWIIYMVYAYMLFWTLLVVLLLLYFLLIPLNDRSKTLWAYQFNRALMRFWFTCCGFTIEVQGLEHLDSNKQYIFIANHCNILDLPVVGYAVQHYYKSLAKRELMYFPVLGYLISVISVFVDRSKKESRTNSVQTMIKKLKQGVSFLIFPEGTRNRTAKPLKDFHSGAFRCAVAAQVPIQIFLQLNTRKLQPVDTLQIYPGKIRVLFLPPISTEGLTEKDVPELMKRVYSIMETELYKEDDYFKDSRATG